MIGRINLLLTFIEYYRKRWQDEPDVKLLQGITNRIAWNLWQMDGLKDTVPLGKPYTSYQQIDLFEEESNPTDVEKREAIPCKIYDWRRDNSVLFMKLKER